MSYLSRLVALQSRVYEFLEHQDEATLRAILDRSAQLAVVHADDVGMPAGAATDPDARLASRPVSTGTVTPSNEPQGAADDLMRLRSGQDRRTYLNGARLSLKQMREVARLVGFVGYSKLSKAQLVDALADHAPAAANAHAGRSRTSTSARHDTVDETAAGRQAQPDVPRSETSSTVTGRQEVDVVSIAAQLRVTETEEEGAVYLRTQNLDRETLLGVAAELQLTRVNRLSRTELEKRVLKQAIGARRKFAGLRRW
ncbi:hypothetical protein [Nocardia sp. NPDC057030]|uniref:hypothetical protein n=1 Tax=unclassified Nocardia TaxID=2637762 RepID=UPI00362FAD2B